MRKSYLLVRGFGGAGHNAAGQRVAKGTPSGNSYYVYGPEGQPVSEFDAHSNWIQTYIRFGGQPFAFYRGTITGFIHPDHLGSTRLVTIYWPSGVTPPSGCTVPSGTTYCVYDNMDYLPFGEQIAGGSATTHKFTAVERDGETTLDHTDFRQYSSQLGRWMSPDPGSTGSSADNPQSWNAYAYVGNDPLNLIDPDGLCGGPPGSVSVTIGDSTSTTDIFSPPCIDGSSFSWRAFLQEAGNAAQKANDLLHAAYQAVVNSRTTCVALATAAGAYAAGAPLAETGATGGATVGAIAGGGVFDEATIPIGSALGGLALGGYGAVKGGQLGYAIGQAACSSGTGSGGGGSSAGGTGLSGAARKKLGNLANRAGEKVSDVIRSRGGSASNVNMAGPWADKTLGETAQAAANGDATAETAIKITKQAGRLGQLY